MTDRSSDGEQQNRSRGAAATASRVDDATARGGLLGLGWRFGRSAAERQEWQARIRELEQERNDLRIRLITLEQERASILQDVEQYGEQQSQYAWEREQRRRHDEQAEHRHAEAQRQIAQLERERDELHERLARLEQEHAAVLQEMERHASEQQHGSQDSGEWRRRAEAAEARAAEASERIMEHERAAEGLRARLARLEEEREAAVEQLAQQAAELERQLRERNEWRRRTEAAELEVRTAGALQREVHARIAHLEARARAVDAVVDAVRASIAELREEGERMLRRPGMWRTEMIATFCNYMAGKFERNLAAALRPEVYASPTARPGEHLREPGMRQRDQ